MKVRIDYSHYVIVDVPDSIIKQDGNGYYGDLPFEFDEMFEVLKAYIPEGAEVEGWEYPDLPEESEEGRIGGHYAHSSLEEHPPDCPWHKDWHACNCGFFDKENKEMRKSSEKDTSRWYNCAHCDAGYPDQECTCENEECLK